MQLWAEVVLKIIMRFNPSARCNAGHRTLMLWALPARSFNPAIGRPESLDTAFLRSSTVAESRSSVTEPLCCPTTFKVAIGRVEVMMGKPSLSERKPTLSSTRK